MSDTLTVSNINYKTLLGQTGSSLSVGSLSMASTVISLGASTNQTLIGGATNNYNGTQLYPYNEVPPGVVDNTVHLNQARAAEGGGLLFAVAADSALSV